jgi:hypothetical protein
LNVENFGGFGENLIFEDALEGCQGPQKLPLHLNFWENLLANLTTKEATNFFSLEAVFLCFQFSNFSSKKKPNMFKSFHHLGKNSCLFLDFSSVFHIYNLKSIE